MSIEIDLESTLARVFKRAADAPTHRGVDASKFKPTVLIEWKNIYDAWCDNRRRLSDEKASESSFAFLTFSKDKGYHVYGRKRMDGKGGYVVEVYDGAPIRLDDGSWGWKNRVLLTSIMPGDNTYEQDIPYR